MITCFTRSVFLFIAVLFLQSLAPSFLFAEMTASVNLDQSVIRAGESTQLTLSITSTSDDHIAIPNTPEVNGLEITFLSKSQSQQIQFDGRQMKTKRTLELTYNIDAQQPGEYDIQFEVPGDTNSDESNTVTLKVLESDAPTPTPKDGATPSESNPYGIFFEIEVSKEEAYIGEEIQLTYTAFLPAKINARPVQIEDRRGQFQGFWTETFDYGKQRSLKRVRLSNGQIYDRITLITYILFPIKAGKQEISPLTLVCEVPERSDIFGFPFGKRKRVKVESKPVTIQAKSLPEEGKPDIFQGAVGKFTLQSQIDKEEIQVGDTVTLKVLLEGSGNIRNAPQPILPDLSKYDQFAPTKDEDIEVTQAGVSGSIDYTYVLVPHDVNADKIDPVRFAYFDPNEEEYFTLETQPHELTVQATDDQGAGSFLSDRRIITRVGDDFRFISTSPAALSVVRLPIYKKISFWFFTLIPIGLLVLGIFLRYTREFYERNPELVKSRGAPRMAKKWLVDAQQAFQQQDHDKVYAHLEKAIHNYISHRWNLSSVGMTTDELCQSLEQHNLSRDCIDAVIDQLEKINSARYSGMAGNPKSTRETISTTEQILTRMMKQKGIS